MFARAAGIGRVAPRAIDASGAVSPRHLASAHWLNRDHRHKVHDVGVRLRKAVVEGHQSAALGPREMREIGICHLPAARWRRATSSLITIEGAKVIRCDDLPEHHDR
jgi:hypothetical protein